MCEPLSLLGALGSIIGSKKPKPPPEPAKPLEDAKADTGAEIVLGSEKSETAPTDETEANKKKAGTSLRTSTATGINIL